jgi:hypothetical protein
MMYVKYTGVSPGIVTDLSADFNGDGQADVSYGGFYTGVYNLANDPTRATGLGVIISDALGTSIPAFCMDVRQEAPGSFEQYVVINLESGPIGGSNTAMGDTRANRIRELFGRFYSTNFTDLQAAAFQASIWEIENELAGNPLNVDAGGIIVGHGNASMQAIANGYLGALTGNSLYFDANVRAIGNGDSQDYVFTVLPSSPQVPSVPEPATIILLVLGGLGLFGRKRTKAVAR